MQRNEEFSLITQQSRVVGNMFLNASPAAASTNHGARAGTGVIGDILEPADVSTIKDDLRGLGLIEKRQRIA